MKQQEVKPLIIMEWDRWVQTQSINPTRASARDSFKFFVELQDARSPLLDFQSRGRDKWQIVYGWLTSEGRVPHREGVIQAPKLEQPIMRREPSGHEHDIINPISPYQFKFGTLRVHFPLRLGLDSLARN